MVERKLTITGMNCQHCVLSLKKELSKIPGLVIRDIGIGSATVSFDAGEVPSARIDEAVSDAGFVLVR